MKQELIRPIVAVGNSAGVILPRAWITGKARIELIEEPLNIEEDIVEMLKPLLTEVKGIYLVGSYVRKEQTPESDIDILVITERIEKRIEKGKYSILLVKESNLQGYLETNILPLLPMIREAKAIVNDSLLETYKNTPITKKNLSFHIETTKSALKMNKAVIELENELGQEKVSDAIAYSLVLRLRGVYIVECLIKKSIPTTKGLVEHIEKVSGSQEAYQGYERNKRNQKQRATLPLKEAKKIYSYIVKKIKEEEQWVKEQNK